MMDKQEINEIIARYMGIDVSLGLSKVLIDQDKSGGKVVTLYPIPVYTDNMSEVWKAYQKLSNTVDTKIEHFTKVDNNVTFSKKRYSKVWIDNVLMVTRETTKSVDTCLPYAIAEAMAGYLKENM